MLSTWFTDHFFKPFYVTTKKLAALAFDTWDFVSFYPFKTENYKDWFPPPIWNMYQLLPFLFLLSKDSFLSKGIRKQEN
jgi:hypothetical protein